MTPPTAPSAPYFPAVELAAQIDAAVSRANQVIALNRGGSPSIVPVDVLQDMRTALLACRVWLDDRSDREREPDCIAPSYARALRDARFYVRILAPSKPERYEVYQTADGATVRLSDAIALLLKRVARLASPGEDHE